MAEETLNLKDIPSTPSKTLEKYQRAIAKEMERRAGAELKAIRKQLKKLAEMTGMQIVEAGEEEGKAEESSEGEPSQTSKESPRKPAVGVTYQHPDDPTLKWTATGGEPPSWLKKALNEGLTLADLQVKQEST